jgi:hypothetical protein
MKARITPTRLTGGTPKARQFPDGDTYRASRDVYRAQVKKFKKEEKKNGKPNNSNPD